MKLTLKPFSDRAFMTYSFVLLLLLGYRILVLIVFGFQYTDADQVVMWCGVDNYSQGLFHEPRFYGQMYNSMLESLLAVPLFKLGMTACKAIPIITTLLTMAPYVLISYMSLKRKKSFAAIVILSIPFLLPIEYDLITTMPRGFVTGIFVASIGATTLFRPESRWSFIILGFTAILGFSLNPNAIMISLPCLIYVMIINRRRVTFYTLCGTGMYLAGMIHLFSYLFYVENPNYNFHSLPIVYSLEALVSGMTELDMFLNNVTPLFWKQGFIILPSFIAAGILALKKQRLAFGMFLICIPLLIIGSLGLHKVHDGTHSVFFPYSRMFLSMPVLIAIALTFLPKTETLLSKLYILLPITVLFYKTINLPEQVEYLTNPIESPIQTGKVKKWTQTCQQFSELSKKYDVELIVLLKHKFDDGINYGCAACTEEFPKTLKPSYERRTWRLVEDEQHIYFTMLVVDEFRRLDQLYPFCENTKIPNVYLVQNNVLPTMEFLDKIDALVRTY